MLERRKRLLLFSHSAHLFGAEISLLELAVGLSARSDVSIEVVTPEAGPLTERLDKYRIPVSVDPQVSWAFVNPPSTKTELAALPYRLSRTTRRIRQAKADVVISNTVTIVGPAIAARILRIPHVWLLHELITREHPLHFLLPPSIIGRSLSALSDAVVVSGRALAENLAGFVRRHDLHVVPPSVELTAPLRKPTSTALPSIKRLLVVGHQSPVKRQGEAIEALAILRRRGHHLELWLVGEEQVGYRSVLHDQAARLGVADLVRFQSSSMEIWESVGDETVVVNCGAAESFGRVNVDAMRRAVPLVAADGAGNRELIDDEVNGLLYSPGKPEALADCIERLNNDTDLRVALSHRGYADAAKRFRMSGYANSIINICRAHMKETHNEQR